MINYDLSQLINSSTDLIICICSALAGGIGGAIFGYFVTKKKEWSIFFAVLGIIIVGTIMFAIKNPLANAW